MKRKKISTSQQHNKLRTGKKKNQEKMEEKEREKEVLRREFSMHCDAQNGRNASSMYYYEIFFLYDNKKF